jgi:hypothetical protein
MENQKQNPHFQENMFFCCFKTDLHKVALLKAHFSISKNTSTTDIVQKLISGDPVYKL